MGRATPAVTATIRNVDMMSATVLILRPSDSRSFWRRSDTRERGRFLFIRCAVVPILSLEMCERRAFHERVIHPEVAFSRKYKIRSMKIDERGSRRRVAPAA